MRRVLLPAVAAALLVAPAASARNINVNWREQVTLDGERVMRLHVDAIAFRPGRWAVRLSFTNTSPRTLTVLRNNFALAVYPPRARNPCRFQPLFASTFWPQRPDRLAPGDTWRGVFSGRAEIPDQGSLRVIVSWFSGGPPSFPRFGWLTDHVYDIGARRGRLAVAPTCP